MLDECGVILAPVRREGGGQFVPHDVFEASHFKVLSYFAESVEF